MSRQTEETLALLTEIRDELRALRRETRPRSQISQDELDTIVGRVLHQEPQTAPNESLWLRAVSNGIQDWPALEALRRAYPGLIINPVSKGELLLTVRARGDIEEVDS